MANGSWLCRGASANRAGALKIAGGNTLSSTATMSLPRRVRCTTIARCRGVCPPRAPFETAPCPNRNCGGDFASRSSHIRAPDTDAPD